MKLYIVSTQEVLHRNAGFIKSTHTTYDLAFEVAEVGEYIHGVYVQDIWSVINSGKMTVRVDGLSNQK